jgi:hypothetical protein
VTRILQQRESVRLPRQSSNNEPITFHTTGNESLVPAAIRSEPQIELPTSYNGAFGSRDSLTSTALIGT